MVAGQLAAQLGVRPSSNAMKSRISPIGRSPFNCRCRYRSGSAALTIGRRSLRFFEEQAPAPIVGQHREKSDEEDADRYQGADPATWWPLLQAEFATIGIGLVLVTSCWPLIALGLGLGGSRS